jgi:lipoprotein-releasing system ATP-binding protein
MSDAPLYELEGVGKEYQGPSETIVVLNDLHWAIESGRTLAVMGASGSGKTTLLHLLGTLDDPSRGTIRFAGHDLTALDPGAKARVRNREIGFIFQFHHLLPEFTTQENVAMPGLLAQMPKAEAMERAARALSWVDLSGRAGYKVTTLSGGERQRAAIARAVFMEPRVLLADEPTGNLDEQTGDMVSDVLLNLNRDLGMTLVVVTHNPALANRMDARYELHRGELHEIR